MIEIKNVSKNFAGFQAVNDISFKVDRGETVGFIGINGAGKSTTMRMLTGFLPPSSGKVIIDGVDIVDNLTLCQGKIGYLPEHAPAYPHLTVRQFLKFCGEIRDISGKKLTEKIDKVINLCSLESVIHQRIENLSKGYQHRVCLAQAIIHDPEILIMDEPTDGLDPIQKDAMRRLIRDMSKEKAIIISTHILAEVEFICDRIIVIHEGKIVFNGSVAEFKDLGKKSDSSLYKDNHLLTAFISIAKRGK